MRAKLATEMRSLRPWNMACRKHKCSKASGHQGSAIAGQAEGGSIRCNIGSGSKPVAG